MRICCFAGAPARMPCSQHETLSTGIPSEPGASFAPFDLAALQQECSGPFCANIDFVQTAKHPIPPSQRERTSKETLSKILLLTSPDFAVSRVIIDLISLKNFASQIPRSCFFSALFNCSLVLKWPKSTRIGVNFKKREKTCKLLHQIVISVTNTVRFWHLQVLSLSGPAQPCSRRLLSIPRSVAYYLRSIFCNISKEQHGTFLET